MYIGYKLEKGKFTNEQYAKVVAWCNENNATIEDKGDYYEVVEIKPYQPTTEQEIARLKAELTQYDYIGTKIAMGVATKEDYADEIAHTEEIRKQIRQLESEIK